MGHFLSELKRRHIYRVGAAYVVVAWALTQAVDVLSQVFALPGWIAQPAVVLLAIGFPVALVAAWMIESRPHEAVAAAVRSKNTTVDWALFGAVAVLIVLTGYQQISQPAQTSGVDAARSAGRDPASAISLAVLPFANLSGDPNQEFFSDGITEEITSALARVPDLRVVARTSAYQFRDQNRDIQSIGQQLRATHFIEGSVRKAGDRVRITAQLVQANNGTQVWSENFDRRLTDIFAIQEDIARSIATSLQMPLGLSQGNTLVQNRPNDLNTYEQYLRAKAIVRDRFSGRPLSDATTLLEQVVGRDPNFAPAWAQLALAYALTPQDGANFNASPDVFRRLVDSSLTRAEETARRAIQLDANLADGYVSLARAQDARGKYLTAEELFLRALALDPNHPDALSLYSNFLAGIGRPNEALQFRQKAVAVDPLVPVYNLNAASMVWLNGQTDTAIAILEALPPSVGRTGRLAIIHAAAGRYREAADALEETPAAASLLNVQEAVRLLRTAPATAPSAETLPRLDGFLDFVYLYVGAPERALDSVVRGFEGGYAPAFFISLYWHPAHAPVRKTARFKTFVRNAGFVDYWKAKGWPDLCRAVGADDFVCD
jgi:TolB-like protein/Tfp pilus assembly protein PilF